MLIASPAWAEWTPVDDNDKFVLYIDKETIRQNGNFVKMWGLTDFKTVQNFIGKSYLSHKSQDEYDCKEERRRLLAFSLFSGKMGNRTVVHSDSSDAGKWTPIEPVSIGEKMWKIACGKK